MKLPDFTDDVSLNELRRAMGAKLRVIELKHDPKTLTPDEINRLAREGIDIPLEEIRVLQDGTLAYKNQRIVLYIRDVKIYRNGVPSGDDLPRYHVADCDTLKDMRANRRYQRYVVATRDSGEFLINLMRHNRCDARDQRLSVCQNCLGALNWDNFIVRRRDSGERTAIVQGFSLKTYFSIYPKTFINESPTHTENTAPRNNYTADFAQIADRIKRDRGYRCERCMIDLTKHRKFLHAHHKNGIQYDNSDSNIELLCIKHHSEQPYHGHMKRAPDYWEFTRLLGAGIFRQ